MYSSMENWGFIWTMKVCSLVIWTLFLVFLKSQLQQIDMCRICIKIVSRFMCSDSYYLLRFFSFFIAMYYTCISSFLCVRTPHVPRWFVRETFQPWTLQKMDVILWRQLQRKYTFGRWMQWPVSSCMDRCKIVSAVIMSDSSLNNLSISCFVLSFTPHTMVIIY